MQSNKKLISVFMVTYNSMDFIEEALDSVLYQEDIDMRDIEIVISDDCSIDNTINILRDYKKRFPDLIKLNLNTQNVGITANCNKVLDLCVGKFIVFAGSDDITSPRRIANQLAWFNKNPEAVLCTSAVEIIKENTKDISGPYHDWDCLKNNPIKMIEQSNQLPSSRWMMNRLLAKNIIFDFRTPTVSDWLFFNEIALMGKVGGIKEVGTRYRRHENNITKSGIKNSFIDDRLIATDILLTKYPQVYSSVRKQRSHIFYHHAKRLYFQKEKFVLTAIICSLREYPFNMRANLFLIAYLMGPVGRAAISFYRYIMKSG
jgi:glycosyltransferase involved in cell wall biosynthesis